MQYADARAQTRQGELERELEEIGRLAGPRLDRPDRHASRRGRLARRIRAWLNLRVAAANPSDASLTQVIIRPADSQDGPQLARLAELDERRAPSGAALVAEVDDAIVAVMPLEGGPIISNPWRNTRDVVQLLEVRSDQLRQAKKLAA